mmetsp:Transcript_35867/g.77588  ORF Transcript_35867/g.77588 Transcript_35867/m.77588 type:complete len:140 (+) Transcript_35867:338-757(+)
MVSLRTKPLASCCLMETLESDAAWNAKDDNVVGRETRGLLLSLVSDTFGSPSVRISCDNSNPVFTDTVRKVFEYTRLFSFDLPWKYISRRRIPEPPPEAVPDVDPSLSNPASPATSTPKQEPDKRRIGELHVGRRPALT